MIQLNLDEAVSTFAAGVYREHVEEMCSLYDQRTTVLTDPNRAWRDCLFYEVSQEAHLDALMLGGVAASRICIDCALEEPGAIWAGVHIACRSGDWDLLHELSRIAEATRGEVAFSTAVASSAPAEFDDLILESVDKESVAWQLALLETTGRRRMHDNVPRAVHLLNSPDYRVKLRAMWAISRVGSAEGLYALKQAWDGTDTPNSKSILAISLLRCGDRHVLDKLLDSPCCDDWAQVPLALAGGPRATEILITALTAKSPTSNTATGLGLLGDTRAIDPLIKGLQNDRISSASAGALQLITGANLREQCVQEDFDGEEVQVTRTAQSSQAWQTWWDANRHRFASGPRYRNGQRYGPNVLINQLSSSICNFPLRCWVSDELSIRYGVDFGFEWDLPVQEQLRCLERLSEWEAGNQHPFVDGED